MRPITVAITSTGECPVGPVAQRFTATIANGSEAISPWYEGGPTAVLLCAYHNGSLWLNKTEGACEPTHPRDCPNPRYQISTFSGCALHQAYLLAYTATSACFQSSPLGCSSRSSICSFSSVGCNHATHMFHSTGDGGGGCGSLRWTDIPLLPHWWGESWHRNGSTPQRKPPPIGSGGIPHPAWCKHPGAAEPPECLGPGAEELTPGWPRNAWPLTLTVGNGGIGFNVDATGMQSMNTTCACTYVHSYCIRDSSYARLHCTSMY